MLAYNALIFDQTSYQFNLILRLIVSYERKFPETEIFRLNTLSKRISDNAVKTIHDMFNLITISCSIKVKQY